MRKASAMIDVTEEDIQHVARLQLAIVRFINRFDANTVAIDCIGLLKVVNVSPCIVVEQLDDRGIPTSCEADLNSLFAKIILSYLSNKPAFMGNPRSFRHREEYDHHHPQHYVPLNERIRR